MDQTAVRRLEPQAREERLAFHFWVECYLMCGPKTLEGHIIPSIPKAAKEAGRPEPHIVAGFPVVVADDVAGATEAVNKSLPIGGIPSYRAMLDREGAEAPADVAIIGSPEVVRSRLVQLRDIGVTHLNAALVLRGANERTRELLLEVAKEVQ